MTQPPEYDLPLPLYVTLPWGTLERPELGSFTLFAGFDEKMVAAVKAHSLDASDTELLQHSSDRKRFGEGRYEDWYAKARVPFALVHDATGAVAAIAWLGPKPLGRKSAKYLTPEEDAQMPEHGDWHTLAYRCYLPFRGKRLMREFVGRVIEEYIRHIPTARVWVIINNENKASEALATHLGFTAIDSLSLPEKHLLVMIKGGNNKVES